MVDAIFAAVLSLQVLGFAVHVAIGPWKTQVFGWLVSVRQLHRSALLILLAASAWAAARLLISRWLSGGWPSFRAWLGRVGPLHASLAVGLALTTAALALRLAIGPWRVNVPGLVLSVDRVDKSIALMGYFALAWLLTTPRAVAARRRGSAFPFYVLTAVVVYLLAMGPVPSLRGEPVFYQAPYAWLMNLPGFDGLRVPTRIWIVAAMCLSIGGGLAFVRLIPPTAPAIRRYGVAVVLGIGILADTWITKMPTIQPPRRSPILEQHAVGPLLEVPPGDGYQDLGAMYRSIFHQRVIGNGYSGFFPAHYGVLREIIAAMEPDLPDRLAALGFREVSVNRRLDPGHRLEVFFAAASGVRRVAGDEHDVLFRLPATAAPAASPLSYSLAAVLEVSAVRASSKEELIPRMFDGDVQSRWDGGIQNPDQELVIDLGSSRPVGALSLGLGPYTTDYPRVLSIDVSEDGQGWTEVWRGPTAAMSLVASVHDPKESAVRFPVGRTARWLRVRQLGQHHEYLWSVTELKVLGQ